VRAYVREKLADPEAVLVIDETGFVKKGTRVGVSAAAVQRHGKAHRELPIGCLFVVRQPEGPHFTGSGTVSAQELDAAPGTLSGSGCAHRGGVCPAFQSWRHAYVFRTLDAEVPACWVTGDTVYGSHRPLRAGLEARKQAYALAVSCQEHVELAGKQQRVDQLAQEVAPEAWQRLSAGAGSKGPRLYDWARLELSSPAPAGWERWLVIRRSIAVGAKPPKMAYVLVFARTGTTLQEIVLIIANASVVMTTHRRINRRAPGIRLSRNYSAEPEPNVLPYPSSSI
jgi:hypothetical protein